MKRLAFLTLALATTLWTIPASAQTTATAGAGDTGVFQTTLKNGLKVIVVEDHAAAVVQTSMWYRFGSLYETPSKTGLAHGLEHMMFRGTQTLSAGGLDDITARLGAQVNGQTDYDYTQYYLVTPADKVGVALAIESDRMAHLALHPADWNVEKLAVLNEIDGDESSPFFNLLSSVRAAAYPASSAGRTALGNRADVVASTTADLAKYYHEWYVPNNASLVVAGDVNHAAIFALAERDFGAIPARKLPELSLVHPKAASGKVVEAQFPFPFEVLDMAYAIPGDTEPGEPAISTLATLINNQRSPFYHALVESNIALAVEANADTQLRGGLMHVFVILNPGHTGDEAQNIFQATMDQVLKSGFDPDLVAASKRLTIADRQFSADSISGYGDLIGYTYSVVGERVSDEDNRLAALTPADLLKATQTYLATPNVIGHLRPNDAPPKGSSQKTDASASDNFSSRAPNGPIIEPEALRKAVSTPTAARSKLNPVRFTLPNGLRVIVQPKHDRSTVYVSGEIDTSSAFTQTGQEGIGRLASSVAPFGSQHYDFTALRKATDDIGAVVDLGQTFSARGEARDFETLLKILADGEEHPAFPEQWLTLQREQLANSLATENSISGVLIDRTYLERLLSPDDPDLRYPTAVSVATITRDDLLAYAAKYWRPDLTAIAIVGDVTPEQAKAAVQAAFGDWSNAGSTPNTSAMPLPPAHDTHDYISTAANQVYVRLGQPAISRTSPDYYAFTLMNEIFGGSGYFESRLWQELRQKRGLVYSAGSSLKADRDRGDFEIELNASPDKVESAVHLIRDELQSMQKTPVTATELSEAKTLIVSGALLSEESASAQVSELLDIAANDLPLDYYGTLNDRYASITAADIQRVAKKYLEPDKLIEVFSGPSGPWSTRGL